MENFMKQIRVKLTGAEEENKVDLGGSRHQKIPIQNWFQASRKMSDDYDDSTEMEHATAVAAAAFAVSSRFSEFSEKKKISDPPDTSLTKTTSKVDGKITPLSLLGSASKRFSGSFKINDDQDNKVPTTSSTREEKKPEKSITPAAPSMKKTPTFSEKPKSKRSDDKKPADIHIPEPMKTPTLGDRPLLNTVDTKHETPKPKLPPLVDQLRPPPPPPPPESPPMRQSSTLERPPTKSGIRETRADAWEREEHRKIKERYEKLLETIDSWEKRKKMRARRKLNKHEHSGNEQKRGKARKKYEDKMKYIDEIGRGARAQADERRKNEVLKAKEKANVIRTTGKLPGACSCF